MTIDWNDPTLLRCPVAATAKLAMLCDNHRAVMVQEGKRLSVELETASYWRGFWAEEAKAMSDKLIQVLGEK